jgi:hypothetical protein
MGPLLLRDVSLSLERPQAFPCHKSNPVSRLHSLHCQQNELGALSPPSLPIPSNNLPVGGPSTTKVLHTENVFSYLCGLWSIVHEIIQKYYNMPQSHQQSINEDEVSFTHGILDRLFAWGHTLPLWLARGNKVTSHGIMLQ